MGGACLGGADIEVAPVTSPFRPEASLLSQQQVTKVIEHSARLQMAQPEWPHTSRDPFLGALAPALDSGRRTLPVLLLRL